MASVATEFAKLTQDERAEIKEQFYTVSAIDFCVSAEMARFFACGPQQRPFQAEVLPITVFEDRKMSPCRLRWARRQLIRNLFTCAHAIIVVNFRCGMTHSNNKIGSLRDLLMFPLLLPRNLNINASWYPRFAAGPAKFYYA